MRQLVSGDQTNTSVVHGSGVVDIEERSLDDSGDHGNGVGGGRVVRIDSIGGHLPLVADGGLSGRLHGARELILVGNHRVGQVSSVKVVRGVVAGVVGVSHHHHDLLELVNGLLSGDAVHPGELADVYLEGGDDGVHHLLHVELGRGWEGLLYVQPADELRDDRVEGRNASLGARRRGRQARQDLSVEVEVLVDESGRETRGQAVQDAPADVLVDSGAGRAANERGDAREVDWRVERDVHAEVQIQLVAELVEVQVGRQVQDVGPLLQVEGHEGVEQLVVGHGVESEDGLEVGHCNGVCARVHDTCEREHVLNVRHERFERSGVRVVRRVGQGEASLAQRINVHLRVR